MEGTAFRAGMRRLSGAVSIVTMCNDGGERRGITVTSVCSLSAEPPSLLACIHRATWVGRFAAECQAFCVNVLARDNQDVAEVFAGRTSLAGGDRFQVGAWRDEGRHAPRLHGALAAFHCRLDRAVEFATHMILIGTVAETVLGPMDTAPLVYVDGGFTTTATAAAGGGDNPARSGQRDSRSG